MTTTKKTTTRKKAASSTTKKVVAKKPRVIADKIPELATNPFAFEVLDATSKQRSKANKVKVLQKYSHPSIKAVSYTHLRAHET